MMYFGTVGIPQASRLKRRVRSMVRGVRRYRGFSLFCRPDYFTTDVATRDLGFFNNIIILHEEPPQYTARGT